MVSRRSRPRNRPIRKRKCRHCRGFFVPDYRHVDRQRYCSKPPCTQASKADASGAGCKNPTITITSAAPTMSNGCSYGDRSIRAIGDARRRRPLRRPCVTRDLHAASYSSQSVSENFAAPPPNALQDSFFLQPAVFVGLIAQLSGCALQEDIAVAVRRLQQLGRDILDRPPNAQETIAMHKHPILSPASAACRGSAAGWISAWSVST